MGVTVGKESEFPTMYLRPEPQWPEHVSRHLVLPVAAYVPWNFGLDQTDVGDLFPPGVMCAMTAHMGSAMVALFNYPQHLRLQLNGSPPLIDYYQVHLIPPVSNTRYGAHYRSAKWMTLRDRQSALEAKVVKFVPEQLKFDPEVQLPGIEPNSIRATGGPYDSSGYWALYAQYGLIPGSVYEIEFVYELPFLKVHGVPLVMCAEVWSPLEADPPPGDDLERLASRYPNRQFNAVNTWTTPFEREQARRARLDESDRDA